MGGIGYALNDDLHVVYTRSSADAGQYPSSYGAYQSAKAANNSLSTRGLLSAGTGNYVGTRWGDYVGVAQDPQVPNAVWQGNEFSAGANFWATEVSQLQTGGNSYVPIVPVRVLDTRFGTGLSGVFSANVPRSFPVAGAFGIPANAVAVTGNVTTQQLRRPRPGRDPQRDQCPVTVRTQLREQRVEPLVRDTPRRPRRQLRPIPAAAVPGEGFHRVVVGMRAPAASMPRQRERVDHRAIR